MPETESCLQTNTQNRRESKRNTKPTQTNINKKNTLNKTSQNTSEEWTRLEQRTRNGSKQAAKRSVSSFDSYDRARSRTVLPSSERRKIKKGIREHGAANQSHSRQLGWSTGLFPSRSTLYCHYYIVELENTHTHTDIQLQISKSLNSILLLYEYFVYLLVFGRQSWQKH